MFLAADEIDALAQGAGDPGDDRRRRLAELGFVLAPGTGARSGRGAALDLGDAVADRVLFGGPPAAHEAMRAITGTPSHGETVRAIRDAHARDAARGLDPVLAYVNAVVPVTRATLVAGASAVVGACMEAGLVYLELSPLREDAAIGEAHRALACTADELLAFQRDAVRRILEVNLGGTLLVEKRLALHLEALVAGGRAAQALGPIPGGGACAACVYDPYCGSTLLRRHLAEERHVAKAWGTPHCDLSMGTFDGVFELLTGPDGPSLRRVHQRWMAARDRVARRLAAG
jgi:hypothetical protein